MSSIENKKFRRYKDTLFQLWHIKLAFIDSPYQSINVNLIYLCTKNVIQQVKRSQPALFFKEQKLPHFIWPLDFVSILFRSENSWVRSINRKWFAPSFASCSSIRNADHLLVSAAVHVWWYNWVTCEVFTTQAGDQEFPTTRAGAMPRNASQPAFTTHHQGLPKNGSVPTFDRIRKISQGERFKPSLAAIRSNSRGNVNSNGDVRKSMNLRLSTSSMMMGSRNNNSDDYASITYF